MEHVVDGGEFFREVTLRICGTLEIEKGLFRTFEYCSRFMPVEFMTVNHMYFDRGKQFILAYADTHGGRLDGRCVEQPPELVEKLRQYPMSKRLDQAEEEPLSTPWLAKGLINAKAPVCFLRLTLQEAMIGALVLVGRPGRPFTREHQDLLESVLEPFAVALSNAIRFRELEEAKNLLADDNRFLRKEILNTTPTDLIGSDGGLSPVMKQMRQVAPTSSPVLLLGETGTGKELLAKALHTMSSRADGPFIACNCGALPDNLMDSELFGHEKGAFTGADKPHVGRFERANGGTIFLDEVGELRPEAQVRLLRVLQQKEIERIGGNGPTPVDIRVVAATHRDLGEMVREGSFREDLLFRLQVFPLEVPPLRRRVQDIAPLVEHFLSRKAVELGLRNVPRLASDALDRLQSYPWPGNVRELENAVERALIVHSGGPLRFRFLPSPVDGASGGESDFNGLSPAADMHGTRQVKAGGDGGQRPGTGIPTMDQAMAELIRRALQRTRGKVGGENGAASLLGLHPSTLRKRMRKLDIPFGRSVSYE